MTIGEESTIITTGELSRAVTLIRGDIKDVKEDISKRPTAQDLTYVHNRLQALEDFQKWAFRFGVPALLGVAYNLISRLTGIQ